MTDDATITADSFLKKIKVPLQEFHTSLAGRDWAILHAGLMLTPPDEVKYFDNPLPYGVALWPSAIALASEMEARATELRGKTVLELGAGTGLPGLVASHAGAHVVQTDYETMALFICGLNGERNGVEGVDVRKVNWKEWDDDQRYDFIIGSDILYADTLHPALTGIFAGNLAPGGRVLLTDPLRALSLGLLESLHGTGWDIEMTKWNIGEGSDERTIGLYEIAPPGG